jgi:hypothetical protein
MEADLTPKSPDTQPLVKRLTCHYDGDQITLISEQRVQVVPPPSHSLENVESVPDFSAVLRNQDGQAVYRRSLANLPSQAGRRIVCGCATHAGSVQNGVVSMRPENGDPERRWNVLILRPGATILSRLPAGDSRDLGSIRLKLVREGAANGRPRMGAIPCSTKRIGNEAQAGIRTPNLPITNRLRYHCATRA